MQTSLDSSNLAPLPSGIRSTGIRQNLRPQLPWNDEEFRILSIDGGGIRGILPAKILDECERHFLNGSTVASCFDMIAGTSTGGIIAMGLGAGMRASDILALYTDHGEEIFPPELPPEGFGGWFAKLGKQGRDLRRVRYNPDALRALLERNFGAKKLGDSERRLVIPTFDAHTKVNVLKTPHHPDFRGDWSNRMVDIALATSAAPTYLPPHRIGSQYYADGGIWANNPVMLALVDALTCYDLDRRKVRILSLGCGSGELRMTEEQIERGGQWHWRDIISVAMDLSSQNADGQAGLLIGRDRLCRIDEPDQIRPIPLDDVVAAKQILPDAGQRLFNERKAELAEFFGSSRPVYEAFHGSRCGQ